MHLGHELVEMDAARARGEARWQGGVERVHQHRFTTADAAGEVDALGGEGRGGVREVGGDESVAKRLELAKRDRLSRVAVDEIPGANATLELANGTVDRGGIEAARLSAVLRLLGRAEARRGERPRASPRRRRHPSREPTIAARTRPLAVDNGGCRPRYRRKGTRDEPLKHASGRGDAPAPRHPVRAGPSVVAPPTKNRTRHAAPPHAITRWHFSSEFASSAGKIPSQFCVFC